MAKVRLFNGKTYNIRIKTKEELNLKIAKRPAFWNEDGLMDYLFGKTLVAEYDGIDKQFCIKARKNRENFSFWWLKRNHVEVLSKVED